MSAIQSDQRRMVAKGNCRWCGGLVTARHFDDGLNYHTNHRSSKDCDLDQLIRDRAGGEQLLEMVYDSTDTGGNAATLKLVDRAT